MKTELSILIPTYNDVCTDSVATLARQAEAIDGLRFEIIVADDGSTDTTAIAANEAINRIARCRYVRREENSGRAAIRNFLASEAQYEWLLFVDSGMGITRADFVSRYIRAEGDPVYGGYVVEGDAEKLRGNLRYRYEVSAAGSHAVSERLKNPERDFHTSNFLVSRKLFVSHPLDDRFRRYGYEDVLWGKRLCEAGITINHIDNPVAFDRFEPNAVFLAKTDEGIDTLLSFRHDLHDYSRLLHAAQKMQRLHLDGLYLIIYNRWQEKWRRNLCGANPSLLLFSLYKLGRVLQGLSAKE